MAARLLSSVNLAEQTYPRGTQLPELKNQEE